jgi:hypothetical protein
MTRKAAKISKEELQQKFSALMKEHERYDIINGEPPFAKVASDLKKVHFDFENFDYESENDERTSHLGPQQIDDFVFIGCAAGGDWEFPVYFIVYLDQNGKTLRAYVPENGNAWNRTTKQAYGNDDVKDQKDMLKQYKAKKQKNLEPLDDLEKVVSNLICYWNTRYPDDIDKAHVNSVVWKLKDCMGRLAEEDPKFESIDDADFFVDNEAMFKEIKEHIVVAVNV